MIAACGAMQCKRKMADCHLPSTVGRARSSVATYSRFYCEMVSFNFACNELISVLCQTDDDVNGKVKMNRLLWARRHWHTMTIDSNWRFARPFEIVFYLLRCFVASSTLSALWTLEGICEVMIPQSEFGIFPIRRIQHFPLFSIRNLNK